MIGIVVSFIVGLVFGVMIMCLMVAARDGDNSIGMKFKPNEYTSYLPYKEGEPYDKTNRM